MPLTYQNSLYVLDGPPPACESWARYKSAWATGSPFAAWAVRDQARGEARTRLEKLQGLFDLSHALQGPEGFNPPVPAGLDYLPFQKAGIAYHLRLRNSLNADEQGTGKTIQILGTANTIGARRLLIICPAGLRLNWKREAEKWLVNQERELQPIFSRADEPGIKASIIISFELAVALHDWLSRQSFDLVAVDEAHYLRTPESQRTRRILGLKKERVKENYRPLIGTAPRCIFATGTPTWGKVKNLYAILRAAAPHVIDNQAFWAFARKYSYICDDGEVRGARNQQELLFRLRGGFMVRRLKEAVLPQLPPKRYKMVLLNPDSNTRQILAQERDFSAADIVAHGVPAGSALPELRRLMGLAKVGDVVQYVRDYLDGGCSKLVLCAYHKNVINALVDSLDEYRPVWVYGPTPMAQRQARVDRFQTDPTCRVFIAQLQAAGVGWTLTAAHDVVMAEVSWTPDENEQIIDRVHRITQTETVLVHYIVVEGSLDARILALAARKREETRPAIDI